MTWFDILSPKQIVPSIFLDVGDYASQNDEMHQLLQRITEDSKGSINDLFKRQRVPREALLYILQQRIRRRLS